MAQELLRLENLAKYYTSAQSVVVGLNQVNLAFQRGEFVAITGESGSGKSTMAHVLGGILPYEGGELYYKGKPTSHYDSGDWERYRRDCVSFISQNYGILPGSSVQDNVTCALRLVGIPEKQAQADAEEILKKVELWDLRRRRAAKLSSGQKQRLSIARALAKPAPVLIADEPTGNLDAENSAKVISLLAEAAKDRLVILITHEFSEAEACVTRHIELRDGRVTMDAQLREVPETAAEVPRRSGGEKKHLSWFVARFQMKARPVWSVLMLCLFAFTVFAMFALAGTFISNLDDTFTYHYDNSGFRNGSDRRVVAARPDGGEFTPEDVEKLLGVRYVDSVEEYGYVTDIQYAYREGVDYEVSRVLTEGPGLGSDPFVVETFSVRRTQEYMPFMRTVPALAGGRDFLTAGRLPENLYEVVAVGGEELLGQTMTVLIQDQKNWGADDLLHLEVTVVGVTDYGEHLYFHGDLGRILTTQIKLGQNLLYLPLPEDPCCYGQETQRMVNSGRDFLYWKVINDLTLGRMSEAEAKIRERYAQRLKERLTFWDGYFTSFALEGGVFERFYVLNQLEIYATHWGEGEPVTALLLEVGLDRETLSGKQDRVYTDWLWERLIHNEETKAYIIQTLEPVFERAKVKYTAVKEDLLAKDVDQLSLEELEDYLQKLGGEDLEPPRPIQRGEMVVPEAIQSFLVPSQAVTIEEKVDFLHYRLAAQGGQGESVDFTILGTIEDTGYRRAVLVHPEDFEEMLYPGKGEQVTLYVEDYAYMDRVLEALHAMGYGAISPYREGAVVQDEVLAAQRTQTLRVCLIALLAVIVLQILLLRAMFSMETESYKLLSNIGLNCATAQHSVFWQVMVFALGGQALGVGLVLLCAVGNVEQVVNLLRYLPMSYRVALCVIHLGSSAFTAVWTMKGLKKQVFPGPGAAPDLDWDTLGEEVEA